LALALALRVVALTPSLLLSDEKFYNSNNHSLAVTTVSLIIEIVLIQ